MNLKDGHSGQNSSSKVAYDRILKRILLLRDDGMLGGRRQLLHILGISQLVWAVALTAVQRGIQASTGSPFTVSFDSSTPFLWAGKYQNYPKISAINERHSNVAIYERAIPCWARCRDKQCETTISCGIAIVPTSYSRRHEPRQIPVFSTNVRVGLVRLPLAITTSMCSFSLSSRRTERRLRSKRSAAGNRRHGR